MVEERHHNHPVVRQQVWHQIQFDERGETSVTEMEPKNAGHDAKTYVRCDNACPVLRLEEGRGWVEMIGPSRKFRITHGVRQQIGLPAKKLHDQHLAERVNGSFFKNIMIISNVGHFFGGQTVVRSRPRNICTVTFK